MAHAGGLDDADGADGDLKARVTGKRSETTRRPSAKFLSTGFGQQVMVKTEQQLAADGDCSLTSLTGNMM